LTEEQVGIGYHMHMVAQPFELVVDGGLGAVRAASGLFQLHEEHAPVGQKQDPVGYARHTG